MPRALQVIVISAASYTVTIQTMATSRLSRFCISSYVTGCVVEHAVVINETPNVQTRKPFITFIPNVFCLSYTDALTG